MEITDNINSLWGDDLKATISVYAGKSKKG